MRSPALAALLAAALGACAARTQPYRFGSPMLGAVSVPPAPLPGDPRPAPPELANRRDAKAIRVVSAPTIREASAAAAAAVAEQPNARPEVRAHLPTPHRIAGDIALPPVRTPLELRDLVGRRDKRAPVVAALSWARELGVSLDMTTSTELLSWGEETHRLAGPEVEVQPGDLLVFDHVESDDAADLVAVVIARDARGVTEFLYLGGGVVRRGFVTALRPSRRRDEAGLVLNTFMRNGRRWPPKGTHYLAGELLSHVVHVGPAR